MSEWQDERTLRWLYWSKGLSQKQIADRLGCSATTVGKWMSRHDIQTRHPEHLEAAHEARRTAHIHYFTKRDGYERVENTYCGDSERAYLHRLLAVAKYGLDELYGKEVHHRNGIPWDNRPENIGLMSEAEHQRHHVAERPRNSDGTFSTEVDT